MMVKVNFISKPKEEPSFKLSRFYIHNKSKEVYMRIQMSNLHALIELESGMKWELGVPFDDFKREVEVLVSQGIFNPVNVDEIIIKEK